VKTLVKVLAAMFIFAVLSLIVIGYFLDPKRPTENELIKNFNQHRATFEQLRGMLEVDTNLSRLADWGVETRKPFFLGYPSEQNFPIARYHEYLSLLKQVGGMAALRDEGDHPDPSILVWGWGWAGDTRHICICWLDEKPTNQIVSMVGYHGSADAGPNGVYRHIDQNWYIWIDW
jgi:hypothetical protein